MSSFDAVMLCLSFGTFSLVAVSYINRRQMRRRLIAQKIEQMKRRIVDIEEHAALIEPLLETKSILIYVFNELVELINKTLKLDSSSRYLEVNLGNAEDRLDKLHANRLKPQLWRLLSSDAAIARARFALNEAGRILRKRQTLGEITASELHLYIAELAWTHAMVGVITLVGQGHQAVNRGDLLKAYSFYKSAQQILMNLNHGNDRRHQFIKELSEIMANHRKSISLNLMPEADYNPSNDTKGLIQPIDEL